MCGGERERERDCFKCCIFYVNNDKFLHHAFFIMVSEICSVFFLFICFLQTAAEYQCRKENFFNELEIVFADVVR